jgi:hypothetical protein
VFDTVRRRVPWVIGAVMALTLTGQAAVAQPGDGVDPSAVANINADRVDGRHAVKSTGNVNLRKGRLMAFSAAGYLPSNIVLGGVATVAALQSTAGAVNEADNPVHWNQLQGVPLSVVNGTTLSILGPETTIAGGAGGVLAIAYPAATNVHYELYPVTPGGAVVTTGDAIGRSADSAQILKIVTFTNLSAAVAVTVRVRLTAFNPAYLSPAKLNNIITVKFVDQIPKKWRW